MRWIDPELRWLLRRARPQSVLYTSQLCLMLVASLLALLDPLLLRWLIDGILTWRQSDMLPWLAATFFGLFVFHYGFASLSLLIDAYARERLTVSIRLRLLRRLQQQSHRFFARRDRGDLLHRLEQDVEQICQLSGTSLTALLRIVVTTTLTVAIMAFLSWKLTLLVLPLVPLMLWIRQVGTPRLRAASDVAQRTSAERMAFSREHLDVIPQVQLLGCQAPQRRRYLGRARRALDAAVRRRGHELGLDAATQLTLAAASAVVLGFGGAQVLAGALTVGGLVAFYTYLSRVFGPTQTLVQVYSNWQRASAGIRRVRAVLDEPLAVADPRRPVALPEGPLSVELSNVSFGYEDALPGKAAGKDARGPRETLPRTSKVPAGSAGVSPAALDAVAEEEPQKVPGTVLDGTVLDGIDLRIEPGERVALIGASGCGKSTLARLLVRAYDPQRGSVCLGGVDARDVRLRDLRSRVALVPQDPVVFGGTLRENLLAADRRADEDRLLDAVELAQLAELVDEGSDGLDTDVGPGGSRLSGGQRQRLAIARALLQDPQLLVLDESTSALDGTTERSLLDALDAFASERTVVLVSHRTTTIRWATRLVLLDEGRVVADGDPHTLYRTSQAFRTLWNDLHAAEQETPESTPMPEPILRPQDESPGEAGMRQAS